jgi:glyoxylase-like metal-dependent hydrolase (beta-lactamase superfamily II)/8-oxo-dGTP pyrophosphatase MutT (NUDIX family)
MSASTSGNLIIPAASVLIFKSHESSELYIVRRSPSLRFFGGFLAFPGGKTARADAAVTIQSATRGVPTDRIVAAARELFEETGILVARRADSSFPHSGAELTAWRRELTTQETSFAQLLSQHGLHLREADFQWLGNVRTPPFAPLLVDTYFFRSCLPPCQEAEGWPGELDQGFWFPPTQFLERWTRGDCLVSPPTVVILRAIGDQPISDAGTHLEKLFRFHSSDEIPPIYFAPQVCMIPLHTQALPPTSYTNAYLVGREKAYLIDPGCADLDEQSKLFRFVDAFIEGGGRMQAVLLTHQHIDHVAAASACAHRYHLPIFAHPATATALVGQVEVNATIQEGDRLDLGTALDARGPWWLEALHTPGHASGHLAFYEPHYRLLFAGDMVSTVSSVVIAPPDGDLTTYLQSLRRLSSLESRLLLPGHGGVSSCPRETIEMCIAHRVQREEQLVAALAQGPRSMNDLLVEVYKGVPEPMMKFARLQLLAGLQKLKREGKVVQKTDMWEVRDSSE